MLEKFSQDSVKVLQLDVFCERFELQKLCSNNKKACKQITLETILILCDDEKSLDAF